MLIPFRNPMVFPAGVAPGFDPSHPGASGVIGSVVASMGNESAYDIIHGKRLIPSGNARPVNSINSYIGPCSGGQSDWTSHFLCTGVKTAAPRFITLALIGTYSGPGGVFHNGVCTSSNATSGALLGAINGVPFFQVVGSSRVDSAISLAADGAYFIAASYDNAALVRFVVTDLMSGRVRIDLGGYTVALTGSNGNLTFCNYGYVSTSWRGKLAAAMASDCLLRFDDLRLWAADPWSFWYPHANDDWSEVGAAAAGFTALRRRTLNQRVGSRAA